MIFKAEATITKKFLLDNNNQETYLQYYLGIPVQKGLFVSPLRSDSSPTCSFYKNKSGDIIFKDFRGDFSGNFISVVMYKFQCSYYKALQIIANDFGYIENRNLEKSTRPIEIAKTEFKDSGKATIQVEIRDFDVYELEWWDSFGISLDTLHKFRVYSCKSVFLNGNYHCSSSYRDPIYGYYRGKKEGFEYWRIYFPKRKSFRFLSNWTATIIQGSQQLPKEGDLLVITKSMKDVMCLYELGITAIAPCSENLFLTDTQYTKLCSRFKNIVLFYDNDLAGISNMNKIRKKFNIKCYWIPKSYKAKDISDFYKKYGKVKTKEFINSVKVF